ncbi:MAG: hypothetical protein FJZ66_10270, partial [Bacteroidetes bacterium]|nr:hypothetical protein [Bacteroidota bacterium]
MEKRTYICDVFRACFVISLLLFYAPKVYAQVDHWETIVYDTSSWRYIVPTAATPMNWIQPGFDASSWNQGNG